MSSSYHPPDAGASLPERDLDTIARRFHAAWGTLEGVPGVKLGCAGRHWRVTNRTQQPPFPGEWLPCLDDDATAGVLLAALAELSDGPVCAERVGAKWRVSAAHRGTWRGTDHEHLGGAVALVLTALKGAL